MILDLIRVLIVTGLALYTVYLLQLWLSDLPGQYIQRMVWRDRRPNIFIRALGLLGVQLLVVNLDATARIELFSLILVVLAVFFDFQTLIRAEWEKEQRDHHGVE